MDRTQPDQQKKLNRFGEGLSKHDSFQDAEKDKNYDPTFEDKEGKHPYEHGGKLNRWSDDIRSEASKEHHVKNEEDDMEKEKNRSDKRRLRLVEKYDNDDYTRFAGADYNDSPFEESGHTNKQDIDVRPDGNWHHPGVSGKSDDGKTWVNDSEYKKQASFVGFGPKNYKRSDDRIYEDTCEALMKSHDVDASNVGVKVSSGVVYLSGKVENRQMKRNAELVIEKIPGVKDIRNELMIVKKENDQTGPDAATKKDLGV